MKARHVLILFSILSLCTFTYAETPVSAPATNPSNPAPAEVGMTPAVKAYCEKLEKSFKKYGWGKSDCDKFKWNHYRNSVLGDPLMWTVFGDVSDEEQPSFKDKDVTVVMCGVHGDEITPIKFCFDLMFYLREAYSNPEKVKNEFYNKVVLVSPLVNPDSYFKVKPSRMNAHGIDPNRNFPTKDWMTEARKVWLTKFRRDKRRNPGEKPNSEPEVIFQVNLIKRYNPDKIVSVHSPLTLLDYDGPNFAASNGMDGVKAHDLLIQMSKDASGYNIKDYPFFPGSLGNWAGQERNIPTYTLELPSSDPRKNTEYWALFESAMHKLIVHNLRQNIAKAPLPIDSAPLTKDNGPAFPVTPN
jgi:protein MpaA